MGLKKTRPLRALPEKNKPAIDGLGKRAKEKKETIPGGGGDQKKGAHSRKKKQRAPLLVRKRREKRGFRYKKGMWVGDGWLKKKGGSPRTNQGGVDSCYRGTVRRTKSGRRVCQVYKGKVNALQPGGGGWRGDDACQKKIPNYAKKERNQLTGRESRTCPKKEGGDQLMGGNLSEKERREVLSEKKERPFLTGGGVALS